MKFKIKQHVYFIFALAFVLIGCKREVPNALPNASFARIYPIDGNQIIMGAAKAPDGGFLLWGANEFSANFDVNGFVMKVDAKQNMVWYKMLGGNRRDEIRSACFDSMGNILVTGMSLSFDTSNRRGDFPSMYAAYLNSGGDIIWEKSFTAPSKYPNMSTVGNKVLYLPNGKFALVGSSSNFVSEVIFNGDFYASTRPYLVTINNQGDTMGTASYDILLDDRASGICFPQVHGINATLTSDGNILLFVVKEASYIDSLSGETYYFDENKNDFTGGVTIFKINPNLHFGYNNYVWKRAIPNMKMYLPGIDYNSSNFCLAPFKMINTPEEQFVIGYPTLTNKKVNYAQFNKEGGLISDAISSTMLLQSYSTDLEFIDESIFLLSLNSLSKLNKNGQLVWSHYLESSISAKFATGIFPIEDKAILIFCSTLNNKKDLDVGCMKFNSTGEVLTQ